MRQGGEQAGVVRKAAQASVQGDPGLCALPQPHLAFGQLQVQLALFSGIGGIAGNGVLIVFDGVGVLSAVLQQPARLQQARRAALGGQRMVGPVQRFFLVAMVVQRPGQGKRGVVQAGVEGAGPAQQCDGRFGVAQLALGQPGIPLQGGQLGPLPGCRLQHRVGRLILAGMQQEIAQRCGGGGVGRVLGVGLLRQWQGAGDIARHAALPGLFKQGVERIRCVHGQRWGEVDKGRSHTTVNRVTSRPSAGWPWV